MDDMQKEKPEAKPMYKHNCKHCIFLGQTTYAGEPSTELPTEVTTDLYYCAKAKTVTARFGDNAEDYWSGIGFAYFIRDLAGGNRLWRNPHLADARIFAEQQGHLAPLYESDEAEKAGAMYGSAYWTAIELAKDEEEAK